MRIAVMGGGFIGGNLKKHYESKGEHVDVLDKDDFSFLDADAVKNYFNTHELYDVVFFSAYIGGTRIDGYNKGNDDSVIVNNIKMFDNIGKCLPKTTKYIYFGSGAQYTKERDLKKVKESELGEVIPTNEYGYAKYICSQIIDGNPNYYNIVLFGIYGENENPYIRFITNTCYKVLFNVPVVINQNVVFDYLYIKDMFKICDLIAYSEKPLPCRSFNATPDKSISLVEIVDIIKDIAKSDIQVYINNPGLNYEYTGDNAVLRSLLPEDFAFTSYEEGFKDIYEFCKKNIDTVDKDKFVNDETIKNCTTKN